jgi:hypothetical protein
MRELLGSSVSFTAVQAALTSLAERIEDELRCRMFWFVPPDRVKFFDKEPPPFGNAVRDKFPEVAGDVLDASRSLGVGLPTGSVFYLMRVMEFGIRRLVKRLRVKPSKVKRKTWDGILKEINSAISSLSALPTLSAKRRAIRDVCAEATAHLNNVRIAWRNPVMHAERTYSPEEAAEVFDNVKAFMTYLATKVC